MSKRKNTMIKGVERSVQKACEEQCVVGVDASRNRSGGAVAHIRGLLESGDPRLYGIRHVHLWAHDRMLEKLKPAEWLSLHRVPETNAPMLVQLWWQYFKLPRLARSLGVNVMYNSDAGSVCPFSPAASLSQDMLSFEPGEIQRYPWGKRARLRLEILKFVQLWRLKHSRLAIFLTRHAFQTISQYTSLPHVAIIPHGIDEVFRAVSESRRSWPGVGPIRCLYVSNAAPYKHQWHVVEAIAKIRDTTRFDIRLRLVGGGTGPSHDRLLGSVDKYDPGRFFVELIDFAQHEAIPSELASADLFVFASSCENLPITLLEAMASGIVICCSNRGPMPAVMGPDAIYFDPEQPDSIAQALVSVCEDPLLRERLRTDSIARAASYTWQMCAEKTWAALASMT